jgi:class 3 adenylate cyclase/predicted ATPase
MTPENPESSPPQAKTRQAAPESALLESASQRADTAVGAPQPSGASEAAQAWLGKSLGKYQVVGLLGKGAAGVVLKAHDPTIERDVAIKVLADHLAADANAVSRFLGEAKAAGKLNHPNVMAIYEICQDGPTTYLVLEYIAGGSLENLRAKNKSMSVLEVTQALIDACKGVGAAHAAGLIHRDIKPANLMRAADGSIKVADFGLAKSTADTTRHFTQTGMLIGTPFFMSPEQCEATTLDHRSDLYALGATYYTLLTGQYPYQHTQSMLQLMYLHCNGPIPDPRSVNPALPEACSAIVARAMAKAPADRYQSAGEMAAHLQLVTASSGPMPVSTVIVPSATRQIPLGSSGHTPARGAREAERRQVTVLVSRCGAFESDAYLELDPEDQAKLAQDFQQVCAAAMRPFGGTEVQCNEQGLLACFGYPVAFEDAARRAARSALGLMDALKSLDEQLRRETNLEVDAWVGLHTGPAIVDTTEDAVTLVGEARTVALRLEDAAAPGEIVCSDATHRLLRGEFRCSGLGPRKIKGMAQPIELFRVEGIDATPSPVGGLTPLTGRDHEVNLLKDRWEQAQEGMGQVALLIGEAGLGKSRLVHTLKEHVLGQLAEAAADAPVIEWRCSPQFQNTGLYPAIEFFERELAFQREEPPQARFDRLLHRLEQDGLARPQTVPLWASLLSLPIPERFPALTLSPVRQREETFRVLLEWLQARAARSPVLFVVEDLHWIDPSTLEFLGQFLAAGLHDCVLTVLTFRPEFKTPWPALGHQTSLALNRLTRRQVGELMRRKAGESLPEELVEQVYGRAGGVPLFVEEYTKMVEESAPGQSLLGRMIPATLQDLVMARLDRIEGNRELAQLAAVLGREFSHDLLAAVAALDEPTLHAELAKLVQAEILYPKGKPPRCTYSFKHALFEDALYNGLVKSRRQQFHARIAEAMAVGFPHIVETQPELLAHHFTEAGLAEKAIGHWLKAGLRSRQRSADREAIQHLTKGLTLLDTLKESPERDEQTMQFLTALGPAYIAVHGYATPEVGPILQRARDLCERIGDSPRLFGIMLGIWEWRIVRGDLRLCVDLAAEGMALAERLNDPGMMMEALFMPGVTMFYRARFAESRAWHEKALAEYDDRGRTHFWTAYTGHNAGVTHRCYLALALWHLGCPDQARKVDRESCELARAIGHAFSLAHAVDFSACLHQFCRLGPETTSAADEEIAIAKEQGFTFWHGLGTLHKGAGMLLQGRHAEALPILLRGLNSFRATGAEVRVPYYLGMLGDAYTQAARFEDAHKVLNEALAVAEKNDDRFQEAELHRLKGELLRAESPDGAGAEACFRQAIETARRQQTKAWELRATMSLSRLWQTQGRSAEAHAALAAIYGTFTEGFTTPDLVDAKALLQTLTARSEK